MPPALEHIDSWIFDLDNTLYPSSANLFALIDEKMGLYIQDLLSVDVREARRIQKRYFAEHGTTLAGLMAHEGVNPHHFLEFVHNIDLARLTPDPVLARSIAALPGRKLVFTNGDAAYAARVLEALHLHESFDDLFDIHHAGYRPKPDPLCYDAMCAKLEVEPARALFMEDMARNLAPAKVIGMTTVWVNNGSEQAGGQARPSFVDYETHCASAWLADLMETV
jgi:putative hydrolase of the HAD superfamily